MDVDKVSATIIQLKNLFLRMHIKLYRNEEGSGRKSLVNIFNFKDKNYMKFDPESFLTLEIKIRDEDWSADKSVIITERSLFQVTNAVKNIIRNIYDGGIFAVDTHGRIIIYADKVEENVVNINYLTGTQRLMFTPTIVSDSNSITYEGARLAINRMDNYIDLDIDMLESLHNTLRNVDLFTYKMGLYNIYLSSVDKIDLKLNSGPFNSNKAKRVESFKPRSVFPEETKMAPSIEESNDEYFKFK